MLATSVSLELRTDLAWMAGAVLLGIIAWFLRREMTRNETAHRDLHTSVEWLLGGNVEWIRSVSERVNKTYDRIDQVRRGVDL